MITAVKREIRNVGLIVMTTVVGVPVIETKTATFKASIIQIAEPVMINVIITVIEIQNAPKNVLKNVAMKNATLTNFAFKNVHILMKKELFVLRIVLGIVKRIVKLSVKHVKNVMKRI